MNQLCMAFLTFWGIIKDPIAAYANSNFMTTLLGALAGAWAGAIAAQRIAERSKARSDLLAELRAANAGIVTSIAICNQFASLKKQHILNLSKNYKLARKGALAAIKAHTPIQYGIDGEHLDPITVAIDPLEKIVFEKLSLSGRATAAVAQVRQSANAFAGALKFRNEMIVELRNLPEARQAILYFGLPSAGVHDQRYPSTIYAIHQYCDDSIFYSKLVSDDLTSYGKSIRTRLEKLKAKDIPELTEVDLSSLAPLLPDEKYYELWTKGFQSRTSEKPKGRWRSIKSLFDRSAGQK